MNTQLENNDAKTNLDKWATASPQDKYPAIYRWYLSHDQREGWYGRFCQYVGNNPCGASAWEQDLSSK